MTPERYDRLMDAFDAACDLAPQERAEAIARLRAEDPELAEALAGMLRQDAQPGRWPAADGVAALAVEAMAALAGAAPPMEAAGPGKTLGNYRLVRELGRGGMATVYEAMHRQIGRRAAIKVLHERVARDPRLAQRFINEARAVNLIRHPGLVEIYELGLLDDGACYLVMEFLDGEPLDQRLRRVGRLSIADAVSVTRQMALALVAVHRQGVVHRDLKPGNVMVARDPEDPARERVKVLDFGIARLTIASGEDEPEDRAPLARTRSDVIMGTPAYMSPEQCRDTARVTDRSDVYSLGVMLFELVTGERPFVSELASEVMTMHVKAPPPPLDGRAPPALARLVARMLAKDPAERPSMEEVAEALRDMPADAALSMPGPARARRPRWPALRRWLPALAALVLAGGGVAAWRVRARAAGMVRVPGGTFLMGSTDLEIDAAYHYCLRSPTQDGCDKKIFEREGPRREVRLSPYEIDATEVTNAAFAAWLNQQEGLRIIEVADPQGEKDPWVYAGEAPLLNLYPSYGAFSLESAKGRFRPMAGAEDRPVSQVTWIGASRYCAAQGKRLPTEAEWEHAARPRSSYRYPWGTEVPRCDGVVFGRLGKQECVGFPIGPAKVGTSLMDVALPRHRQWIGRLGARAASLFGVHDLGGNVSEWVQDRFLERYPDCGACLDPVISGPEAGAVGEAGPALRVIRGGDWENVAPYCRAAGRARKPETLGLKNVGFRCARSLQE